MKQKPKHMQVSEWIKQAILEGEFLDDEKIPSENELAQQFQVSRQTVRQAIATVENEGLLVKVQGSGTFVRNVPRKFREKTMNIGVIITYLDDYVFPSIVRGIESVLTKNNYTMSFGITYNKIENEGNAIRQMLRMGVDGLIVEGTKSALPNPNSNLYKKLKMENIPTVFINGYYGDISDSFVVIDDVKAAEMVCEELISNGHTKIGGLFKSDDMQGHKRYEGFANKMFEHHIPIVDDGVIWYTTEDFNYNFQSEFDRVILKRIEGFTAMICYNDLVAVKLIELLKRNNLSVPQDISLISFDNSSLAQKSLYNLTSVMYPSYEIGVNAASGMMEKLANPTTQVKYKLDVKLKARNSVKRIK